MTLFGDIFLNNILPAFLIMAAGVFSDRKLRLDKIVLSRLAIYVLTPCLVFSAIVRSSLSVGQFGRVIAYVLATTAVMCALALAVGWALRWPPRTVDALVLSVGFVNAGNFGLSVILFSFGEAGLEIGTVFFVASNLTCNTLAAFFAARGNGGTRQGILKAAKLPGMYAFGLAVLLLVVGGTVPEPLFRAASLIGQATVPVMLLLLGMQLSQTQLAHRYGQVAVGVVLRLVVGALVGIGMAPMFGLEGLARSVVITEAATPTAVNSALMAIQFDADADYVTSVIFFSTLLSAVTLTILLMFLG